MAFTETPAHEVLHRGQEFFNRIYGPKAGSMMRVLGECGSPDLAAAARLMYAFFLSNSSVLSAKETMLVIVAGGIVNGVSLLAMLPGCLAPSLAYIGKAFKAALILTLRLPIRRRTICVVPLTMGQRHRKLKACVRWLL